MQEIKEYYEREVKKLQSTQNCIRLLKKNCDFINNLIKTLKSRKEVNQVCVNNIEDSIKSINLNLKNLK
tara:strand:- start:179 stop:385 length:207 start_codon:yes stop_codon:yes gene_type:complete